MGYSDWIALGSLIVASLAIIGTLCTYIIHERKIKKQTQQINNQTQQINEYQLKKILEEEAKKAKAQIKANTFKSGNNWKIRIFNKGAKAENIRFTSEDIAQKKSGITLLNTDILPYPLLDTEESFDISISLCEAHNPMPKIKLIWDDETEKDQEREQILDLTF